MPARVGLRSISHIILHQPQPGNAVVFLVDLDGDDYLFGRTRLLITKESIR
jgi:hypothetical protein